MKSTAFWISSPTNRESKGDRGPQYPAVTVSVVNVLKQVLQGITGDLFHREPVITTFTDDGGQVWWQVSLPASNQVLWFVSENELRAWLDNYR